MLDALYNKLGIKKHRINESAEKRSEAKINCIKAFVIIRIIKTLLMLEVALALKINFPMNFSRNIE